MLERFALDIIGSVDMTSLEGTRITVVGICFLFSLFLVFAISFIIHGLIDFIFSRTVWKKDYQLDCLIYRHILLTNGFKPELVDEVLNNKAIRKDFLSSIR